MANQDIKPYTTLFDIVVNIDDSTPVVKKMHPAPKPAPLRVGDIEREPTLKGM